jgi:hypothetical protein
MKRISTIIIAITLLTSCKKDKENPVITVSSPEEHSEHVWGSKFNISAQFSDDIELANYHVHIGDSSGEHTHEFDYEREGNISGFTYDFSGNITVPDSIGMMYWLHFEVMDAESKSTSKKVMLHFMEM